MSSVAFCIISRKKNVQEILEMNVVVLSTSSYHFIDQKYFLKSLIFSRLLLC